MTIALLILGAGWIALGQKYLGITLMIAALLSHEPKRRAR